MSGGSDFKKLTALTERMRSEWDLRVAHDYRYWMSDGVASDTVMWETGERDLDLLLRGLNQTWLSDASVLELGCGVGRILRAASKRCSVVTGVDISPQAIDKAKRLLADRPNVTLKLVERSGLAGVADSSVDLLYTFAALSSMPVSVIVEYLLEFSRVLKPGGILRLQVYLGSEQSTCEADTLAIRSFRRDRFEDALSSLGFQLEWIEELVLPFEISDREAGVVAHIVSAKRISGHTVDRKQLQERLVNAPEAVLEGGWVGSRTAYLMALTRAQQHLDRGRVEDAYAALKVAVSQYQDADADVLELLDNVGRQITNGKPVVMPASSQQRSVAAASMPEYGDHSIWERNLRVLEDRFPSIAGQLKVEWSGNKPDLRLDIYRGERGLAVISVNGTELDQRDKPDRAGEVWAERALNGPRIKQVQSVVVGGFAGGYHIRALCRRTDKRIHVIEPSIDILRAALSVSDCVEILGQIATLTVGVTETQIELALGEEARNAELIIYPQSLVAFRSDIDELKRIVGSIRGLGGLRPSIAVVGPIYGGSLPIAAYTVQALKELNQRVRFFDMAPFASAYAQFGEVVRDKNRVSSLQNYYVENLSQVVLEAVTERPVDIVICLAQAPLSPRVLTELRNRGIITVMWFVEDCRRFDTWKAIARYFDYMFLIQRDVFPGLVEQAGAGRAIYLPVGVQPNVHRPLELTADELKQWGSQLSFVGAGYNNRQQMFATLALREFKIWGTEWPGVAPFDRLVQDKGRRITPGEYVKIFNASTINLNLHSSMERDGVEPFGDFVNPRTFELAGCGAFQLVDNRALLPELFEVGREVVTFSDKTELENKIDYYLAHPEERKQVAQAGRVRALRDHTYAQRLRSMLGYIYADRFDELSARLQQGPWRKTLEASASYPELHQRFSALFERGDEPNLQDLVADIQTGKGTLTEAEQRLLFLYHIKTQIAFINDLKEGKRQ